MGEQCYVPGRLERVGYEFLEIWLRVRRAEERREAGRNVFLGVSVFDVG